MAVRKKLNHDQKTREKIQTTQLINRLEKHILAKGDSNDIMTQSQVTAALGLIKKTLPDLSAVEYTGSVEVTNANELTDEQLAVIATTSSQGTVKKASSKSKVH